MGARYCVTSWRLPWLHKCGLYELVEEGKTNQSRSFLPQAFSVLLRQLLCLLQSYCHLSSSNTDVILINTNMNIVTSGIINVHLIILNESLHNLTPFLLVLNSPIAVLSFMGFFRILSPRRARIWCIKKLPTTFLCLLIWL